jgi:hypothetical protein
MTFVQRIALAAPDASCSLDTLPDLPDDDV